MEHQDDTDRTGDAPGESGNEAGTAGISTTSDLGSDPPGSHTGEKSPGSRATARVAATHGGGDDIDEIHPAELQEFDLTAGTGQPGAIELLADVVLPVTVELGRVSSKIGDLLQTGPGSILELDRRIDAPVDIVAGGRLIARGEVVVVGDSLGVRVTELVRPGERSGTRG